MKIVTLWFARLAKVNALVILWKGLAKLKASLEKDESVVESINKDTENVEEFTDENCNQ